MKFDLTSGTADAIEIPARAGIEEYQLVTKSWTPACARVTTFYEAAIS